MARGTFELIELFESSARLKLIMTTARGDASHTIRDISIDVCQSLGKSTVIDTGPKIG